MKGQNSSLQAIFRAPARELAGEFPALAFTGGPAVPDLPSLTVTAEHWESQSFNFHELDSELDALAESQEGPFALVLPARIAREVLPRCQRWADRRNEASRGPRFDRVLATHRQAHDLAKPLVRA